MLEIKNPNDRRVLKTKRAIRNALARLLTERELTEITVTDVADLADINRKTFYNYYTGVHQVVGEIEDEIARDVGEILGDLPLSLDPAGTYGVFEKLAAVINTDMEFYGALLQINGNANLTNKLTELLKDRFRLALAGEMGPALLEIGLDYAVSGMMAVFRNWLLSDRTQSIETVSQTVGVLFFRGMEGLRAGATAGN